MTPSIKELEPEPDKLIALPAEEVAALLLIHLNSDDGSTEHARFGNFISKSSFFNYRISAAPFGYQEYGDRQPEVNDALHGAWAWLQTHGFLVNEPHNPPEMFTISKKGSNVKSLEDFARLRSRNALNRRSAMTAVSLPTKSLSDLLRDRDLAGVNSEFDRALGAVENDPATAVTAACSILESLFKIYIEDHGLSLPGDQTLMPLWKTASKHVGLDPAVLEDGDLRKVLSGLTSVVDGIGALRTHTGSAHGRGRDAYALFPSHARLAIHASHTVVNFFLEIWDQRKSMATSHVAS
jgi:hypothetical protein